MQTPIRGLRSFCIAAKCLSFKHAAAQLFLTPSAVSHQIKQLEQQVGIELFHRQTRAIELTNAGRQFYEAIAPLIGELEATIAQFSNNKQNSTITISLPEFFASELFVPRLNDWAKQHPQVNLQLETVKSASDPLKSGDLSIVLASSKPNASQADDLFPLSYVPACNKKLYQELSPAGYDALTSVPLILHRSRPWSWHQWAERCGVDNFDPKQIIQFDSMFGVARAAQQGVGIALVPLPISQAWFNEQLLVKLFDHELVTKDRYYLIRHQYQASAPELNSFTHWIKQTFTA
ncbi:LysR substrate-binding domain-containing protein [Thalassomonas haliotis]|uniref:LysR family transcriptional regulator n=1 Tax=Thalassomonas haliotis TaxID=485448 RepID=A0ABY7VLN4_9GAMM|nr:LysR substrate-binding domain-containing protein [Thalassomonas haliotis]WDE14430.1 LysR family transcriptional regulator [Thalassomonas haliotis]